MLNQRKIALAGALFAIFFIASFTSCSHSYSGGGGGGAPEESSDFVSEKLDVYKLSNTPSDTLDARFYKGEHYIPLCVLNQLFTQRTYQQISIMIQNYRQSLMP